MGEKNSLLIYHVQVNREFWGARAGRQTGLPCWLLFCYQNFSGFNNVLVTEDHGVRSL